MRITIEVEPVLYKGRNGDDTYYAFIVVGLQSPWGGPVTFASSGAGYPGNDEMRKFINTQAANHQGVVP